MLQIIQSAIQTPITTVKVNTVVLFDDEFAIIFDPSASVNNIKKVVGNKKVLAIILTHGHWDHFFTLQECLEEFGCPYYLHANAPQKLKNHLLNGSPMHHLDFELHLAQEGILIKNSQGHLNIGPFDIFYISTKGHSDCSLTFLVEDGIICGDVLRLNKLARLDLPTASADDLKNSIQTFQTLPPQTMVYNGHEQPDTLQKYLVHAVL